jgi:plasmid maintenance system killer protein
MFGYHFNKILGFQLLILQQEQTKKRIYSNQAIYFEKLSDDNNNLKSLN